VSLGNRTMAALAFILTSLIAIPAVGDCLTATVDDLTVTLCRTTEVVTWQVTVANFLVKAGEVNPRTISSSDPRGEVGRLRFSIPVDRVDGYRFEFAFSQDAGSDVTMRYATWHREGKAGCQILALDDLSSACWIYATEPVSVGRFRQGT
jgi:hypothetical protein